MPTADLPASLLRPFLAAASEHAGVPVEQVEVLRAEAVTWPDGSLGCPEPGQQYTQALVDGYWVVLRVDGQELDYRLADGGTPRLCAGEGGTPLPRRDV